MKKQNSRNVFRRISKPLNQRGSIAMPHAPIEWLIHSDHHLYTKSDTSILGISLAAILGTLQLGALAFGVYSIPDRTVDFNYSNAVPCVQQIILLPNSHSKSVGDAFSLEHSGGISIAGIQLTATSLCATTSIAPDPGSSESLPHYPTSLPFLKSNLWVTVGEPIDIIEAPSPETPIATDTVLTYTLAQNDTFFNYAVSGNNEQQNCTINETKLSCPTAALKLEQAKTYSISLLRTYNDITQTPAAAETELTTVSAVKPTKFSIASDATIYDKPTQLVVDFDKPLASAEDIIITTKSDEASISISQEITDSQLVISFDEDLPRNQDFVVSIPQITATDEGVLSQPITHTFTTSGGPSVSSTSLASYGTSYQPSFTLTFDYPVDSTQAPNLLRVTANNQDQSISASVSGATVTIRLNQSLGRCQDYTVTLAAGLENIHGVDDGSAWSRSSRTLCQSVSTIGSSVNGSSINAYSFGTGGQTFLFVGGTHGSEPSSVYTLRSWIDALEADFDRIPSNARVVVVPNINPDGFSSGDRRNANGVDLNRNFPANNWKKDVTVPGGELVENGGGNAVLSEPESTAIANYTLALNPTLVLTYHARGAFAIANESGNSLAKAQEYGSLSGFSALGNSEIAGIFDYDTTGAYEDWLHDVPGIPALLIELRGNTGNEFVSQQKAMWAMIQ